MTLGQALADRVQSLARTRERLHALDDQTTAHVVDEADAEAVLRRALAALSTREGYDLARRIVAGERVAGCDELAKAGLVVWDPAADSERPAVLLVELMKVLEPAVSEALEKR